jgi:AcrR family transcriptional regulator
VRKKPRQERAVQTVRAILQAASQVLVEEGYAAATTTRVAEVAGVSIGTLYQYFPSREALVAGLIDGHIAKVLDVLGDSATTWQDAPLETGARAIIRVLLRMHAIEPKLHVVLTQSFPQADGFERVRALNLQSRAVLENYFRRRRKELRPVNLELATVLIVNAVQACISAVVLDESIPLDSEDLVEELTQLVVGYLRKPAHRG